MIKYEHFDQLQQLVADRFLSARPHPRLPLTVYNYTVKAQMTPVAQWAEPMKDCRGLILDREGYIVGRPFRKFWNLSQQLEHFDPSQAFTVWEKMDGSLGIVCSYAGERVVSTRGSFESDQAIWFGRWLEARHRDFTPSGETWLFEIIYPINRIVVDYGDRKEGVLLAVMSPDGVELSAFHDQKRFTSVRQFSGITDFSAINQDPQFAGEEGFVIKQNGMLFKVKLDEYCRLHRLITQCSTRTIWELLRSGGDTKEITDRVPDEFKSWVELHAVGMLTRHTMLEISTMELFSTATSERFPWRKDFALWATSQDNPQLLFALLDGKEIGDMCWKLVEPKWATPFRKETEDV